MAAEGFDGVQGQHPWWSQGVLPPEAGGYIHCKIHNTPFPSTQCCQASSSQQMHFTVLLTVCFSNSESF